VQAIADSGSLGRSVEVDLRGAVTQRVSSATLWLPAPELVWSQAALDRRAAGHDSQAATELIVVARHIESKIR
jgi:hypothetical protein